MGPLPHHIAAFLEASLNESKLKIVSERAVPMKHRDPDASVDLPTVTACLQGHLGWLPRLLQPPELDLVSGADVWVCCLLGSGGGKHSGFSKELLN